MLMSVFEQDVSTVANRTARLPKRVFVVIVIGAKVVEEFVRDDYYNREGSRPNRSETVCLLRYVLMTRKPRKTGHLG